MRFRGPRAVTVGWPEPDRLDGRDAEAVARLRGHTATMTGPEADAIEQGVIDVIRRRRVNRKASQLDAVRRPGRSTLLVVRGELLLRRADLDGALRRHLGADGWTEVPVGCEALQESLVRLECPTATPSRVETITGTLRARGIRASASYMTPLAPVGKATGGAEPARPLDPFEGTPAERPVRVAVVDSGIDAQRRGDGWLTAIDRRDTGDAANVETLTDDDGLLVRAAGHGTFVAGIVQRVAPAAEVSVYRAELADGVGSEVQVACAILRAVRDGHDLVNLSFGTQTLDDLPPLALEVAFDLVREWEIENGREVLFVAAAGNYGDSRPCFPAAVPGVVAVGALLSSGKPAPWSSHGHWVTCSTVGEAVRSTYVVGEESPEFDPGPDTFEGPDAWAWWSGSSFAAPQIAGALARRVQDSGRTPREELAALLAEGVPVPGLGRAVRVLDGA